MGFFSKSEPAAETLPTTSAGDSKAEAPEEKKGGGMFCGMSLTEALILLVILGLFIFFVLWPIITAYFFMVCFWIIMWPFVKFIPACGNHTYVGPIYTVLTVIVTSPIKVGKFMYDRFKGGKKPEEEEEEDATVAAAAADTSAAATATVQEKV